MSIFELDSKIADLREIQQAIAELEAKAEEIKDMVKTKMMVEGTEELTGNGWHATWHTVTTARLDSKRLKADHPEIYSQYSKSSSTTRFTLA